MLSQIGERVRHLFAERFESWARGHSAVLAWPTGPQPARPADTRTNDSNAVAAAAKRAGRRTSAVVASI